MLKHNRPDAEWDEFTEEDYCITFFEDKKYGLQTGETTELTQCTQSLSNINYKGLGDLRTSPSGIRGSHGKMRGASSKKKYPGRGSNPRPTD